MGKLSELGKLHKLGKPGKLEKLGKLGKKVRQIVDGGETEGVWLGQRKTAGRSGPPSGVLRLYRKPYRYIL